MRYYLIDKFPEKTGLNRFVISTTYDAVNSHICSDKSIKALERTKRLLLKCWEGPRMPIKPITPQKDPFLCVTGHFGTGFPSRWEPWFQIKAEVERRGYTFDGGKP